MGVGAEVAVGALVDTVWIVEAEIFLVFLVAVVFLDEGVGGEAALAFGALLVVLYIAAHFSGVEVAVAPAVFGGVVVDAVFVVVIFGDIAGVDFEDIEVEVLNEARGTLTVGAVLN